MDSDLSGGKRYPPFEQLGPEHQSIIGPGPKLGEEATKAVIRRDQ